MKKQTLVGLIKEELNRILDEQEEEDIGDPGETGMALLRKPKKKKYKFSKKVQMMQKMMAAHPEIGNQIKALLSRKGRLKNWADGLLGRSTRKAIRMLRRHYRGKAKIPRGVSNIVDFLASDQGGAGENRAAKQLAIGQRAGEQGHKIRSRVDRVAKMPPEQQGKLLKTMHPNLLRKFKSVADKKGYKKLSLTVDALLAGHPTPEKVPARGGQPEEKRMDPTKLANLKATWDAACKRKGMVATDQDPGRGRFTCERAAGAGEAETRQRSVRAGSN